MFRVWYSASYTDLLFFGNNYVLALALVVRCKERGKAA
jgi:hypothetical protein